MATMTDAITQLFFDRVISVCNGGSNIRLFLIAVVTIPFVLYYLYQWLLPKPIPGIA